MVTGSFEAEQRTWKQRLLSPVGVAAVLLAGFFLLQGWQAWSERALYAALNDHPAFASPQFPLEFSRNIQYDPLSFVGRGARAGLWQWTPEGLNLTERGKTYFRQEGSKFISTAPAGRRRVTRIRSRTSQDSVERIDFFYEWIEISPVSAALLHPAPVPGQEFLAAAVVEPSPPSGWLVLRVETRDFDEPLVRLQEIASGVLK
jgi:hypothetical protein